MNLELLVNVASAGLGIMFTGFAGMNLLGDFVGGTFLNKFIYEMDQVMGGQLGLPHYSKVEACMLALGAAGAWSSLLAPERGTLLPVCGFISAAAYMFICSAYAVVTGGSPVAPFACIGAISTAIVWQKWDQLEGAEEVANATMFAQVMSGLTVLAAVVMKTRDTDERKGFNRRFVAINKFCEKNPDFVWKTGADAPSGFKME